LSEELIKITINSTTRQNQLDAYAEISKILGEKGASEKAGELMVAEVKRVKGEKR